MQFTAEAFAGTEPLELSEAFPQPAGLPAVPGSVCLTEAAVTMVEPIVLSETHGLSEVFQFLPHGLHVFHESAEHQSW